MAQHPSQDLEDSSLDTSEALVAELLAYPGVKHPLLSRIVSRDESSLDSSENRAAERLMNPNGNKARESIFRKSNPPTVTFEGATSNPNPAPAIPPSIFTYEFVFRYPLASWFKLQLGSFG